MRWDALAGEWVVIAAATGRAGTGRPGHPSEIPASSYDVAVFENRFPSLAEPLGRCEVVCFTSSHSSSFAALPPRRVRTVLEAWIDRTTALAALPGTKQVYCFENRGEEIGVTLHHPHGQIYAFPFVAPRLERMVAQAARYEGGNLFDDMVAAELAFEARVVTRNSHWVAFVPEAARWPYEVRLFPADRVPDLPALGEEARAAFGPLYLDVLRRFDALFDQPAPYIAAWFQAPVGDQAARDRFAAHLQVLSVRRAAGKLKYLAGTESGMGEWINDIVPEEAAQRLREA
jgi:UDPglucose--hexose-1-phosphate uridylyltransferase